MASDKTFWQYIERRELAREQLKASRRTLLTGAAGAGALLAAGAPLGSSRIARAQDAPNLEGVTLRVFTQTGPFISGPVKFHPPEFQELTGAVVEAIEAPNADL